MSNNIDQQILLKYFFKKEDTILDKTELIKLSCICYDSEQKSLYALTNRFKNELEPYKEKQLLNDNIDDTLQQVLTNQFKLQEELVRCDLKSKNGVDFFYIAVIGADFFQIEKELREK